MTLESTDRSPETSTLEAVPDREQAVVQTLDYAAGGPATTGELAHLPRWLSVVRWVLLAIVLVPIVVVVPFVLY